MPSIFGHSAVGATAAYVCKTRFPELNFGKFLALSLLATNLPDIDIFLYQSALGKFEAFTHRNFFHSLLFTMFTGALLGFAFYSNLPRRRRLELAMYFFLVTASHAAFDAFTKGFGVAYFYPFDKTQYNFPITPLNPAGWSFHEFDMNNALGRECLLVWLPMLSISAVIYFWRKHVQVRSSLQRQLYIGLEQDRSELL